jgi:hypothetical protein
VIVCGGAGGEGIIDRLAPVLRKSFGAKLKGGGKGRFAGKLTGRWGAEELRLLREVLAAAA